LADIEARLEDAEKRAADLEQEVQEREAELNDREGEMEEKIRDALMAKKGLERENRQLREEMKSWREIGAGVIKRMGVAGLVKFERPAEGVAGDAELVGTGDEVQARGTKRTAVGTAKSAATDSKATDRVVKRDVPRQRSTPRDAPPSAEEQSDVEGAAVKAEPVHRGYRTRTTGPAPAVLRGDLRTTASTVRVLGRMMRRRYMADAAVKSDAHTSSADRSISRQRQSKAISADRL
jgi:FtsZ-binding cell division protein ZapB